MFEPSILESDSAEHPFAPLTVALRAVASAGGLALDHDDLRTVLGAPFLTAAGEAQTPLTFWATLAQDAFLAGACRPFGIGVRGLHPPSASPGYFSVSAFAQHFEASYRPMARRALEHGQPVLAWCPQEGAHDPRRAWRLITETCPGGVGLAGPVIASEAGAGRVVTEPIVSVPLQLHVVERIVPTSPSPSELLAVAIRHWQTLLSDESAGPSEVVTGPRAYSLWASRIERGGSSTESVHDLADGHALLTEHVLAAQEATLRMLKRHRQGADARVRSLLDAVEQACRTTIDALSPGRDAGGVLRRLESPADRKKLAEQIGHAQRAVANVATTIGDYAVDAACRLK